MQTQTSIRGGMFLSWSFMALAFVTADAAQPDPIPAPIDKSLLRLDAPYESKGSISDKARRRLDVARIISGYLQEDFQAAMRVTIEQIYSWSRREAEAARDLNTPEDRALLLETLKNHLGTARFCEDRFTGLEALGIPGNF